MGVMQIELGAPMTAASRAPVGVLPLTARVAGSGGTSIVNIRRNLPSASNTWMPVGAIADVDVVIAVQRNHGAPELSRPVPFSPHDFTQSPCLSSGDA
jgi:hypothetical protein